MLLRRGAFFAGFILTHRDNGDKRDKMRSTSQEPSFDDSYSDSQNGGYVEANTGDSLPGRQHLLSPLGRYSPKKTTLQYAAESQSDTGFACQGLLRQGYIAATGDQCEYDAVVFATAFLTALTPGAGT